MADPALSCICLCSSVVLCVHVSAPLPEDTLGEGEGESGAGVEDCLVCVFLNSSKRSVIGTCVGSFALLLKVLDDSSWSGSYKFDLDISV